MRISDWSSDVCSSDLVHPAVRNSLHDTSCRWPLLWRKPSSRFSGLPEIVGLVTSGAVTIGAVTGGALHDRAVFMAVEQDPIGGAVQILVLVAAHRPQKRQQSHDPRSEEDTSELPYLMRK